jgi:UDP-N-acetylmuramoyl-tripeptide--D-alanyl-D-alanine ligase
MENLTIKEILGAVDGELLKAGKEAIIDSVSTDTRTIKDNSLFVALKGEKFNGNEYAVEAAAKGAVICIIDEIKQDIRKFPEAANIIKVRDSKKALRDLAKYYRSRLHIKVVGITGSTGKTSTKDLVAAVLSAKYKVFKTKGNFNNEIGLPLMIFNLDNSYDIAVLEMGMSDFGEIHRLADIARPDIAMITNIGVSHIEYLKTRENILKAKLEITDFFKESNILIVNSDNDLLDKVASTDFDNIRIGIDSSNLDFYGDDIVLEEDSIKFIVSEKNGTKSEVFQVPVPGKHNILNSLLAIACGKVLGLSYHEMAEGIKQLQFTSMRLDIVRIKDITIIDDSYNASPDSMKAAVEVLANMNGSRKIAVLGTMKELGSESYMLHTEVGQHARKNNIDMLLLVGEYSPAYMEGFNNTEKALVFSDNQQVLDYLLSVLKSKDVVLVKASRSMKFEAIVNNLKIKMS